MIDKSKYTTVKELIDFVVANKGTIIAQKKSTIKHADGITLPATTIKTIKGVSGSHNLEVKAVINTTNLMDSHDDVHMKGLWKKSLSENKNIMHLQEHTMAFDKIIADGKDLQVSVKSYTWKELGYNFPGTTDALLFDSVVKMDRNPFMYKQYMNGNVNNHSVGMQYVKIVLAVNDKEYTEEYAAWEKYFPEIVNKETATNNGYFFAVLEAKVIEGSAVPIGSNFATPTLEVNEPGKSTPKTIEPQLSTQKAILLNILKTI